jgi:hypothetical protein
MASRTILLPSIYGLDASARDEIRAAVYLAMDYWPNAHLGSISPRDDMHSAFRMIRNWQPAIGLEAAVARLESDARAHRDM